MVCSCDADTPADWKSCCADPPAIPCASLDGRCQFSAFSTSSLPQEFIGLVSEYIHASAQQDPEREAKEMATKTWANLKRSAKAGPRRTLPTLDEIDALINNRKLRTIVSDTKLL